MAYLKQAKFYSYLLFNWSPSIAWHMYKHDRKGERKYRVSTAFSDNLKHLENDGIDISHSTFYMPASYELLEKTFEFLQPLHLHHLVDIGCGMGRAMAVAAHYDFKKITGIDLSEKLCIAAAKNMQVVKKHHPEVAIKVMMQDAFYYEIPDDADCIFLFNPFDAVVLKQVLKNIDTSRRSHRRKIFLVYLSSQYDDILSASGYKKIWHFEKLYYLRSSVYLLE